MKSRIEWTDRVWNPITGCTPISEGCKNCYAKRMATRLAGRYGYDRDVPFRITIHRKRIGMPYAWKKPSRVFVCSMGDLFHKDVPDHSIREILRVMRYCPEHTFMVLTKRIERAKEFIDRLDSAAMQRFLRGWDGQRMPENFAFDLVWPNVWIGTSIENQATTDERIPILLQIPAAVHFVSVEPMLEPVNLGLPGTCPKSWGKGYMAIADLLDWVICGGESGPKRRPFDPDWARDLRDQCKASGVPFFMKQIDKMKVVPDDLAIREFPKG